MEHRDYCNEKSTAVGYCWPYIKLYIGSDKQTELDIVLAYRRELEEIAERQLDPEIVKLRLHWWRNEIDKNTTTSSQHPILQAVKICQLERVMTSERMLRMVDAIEMELDTSMAIDEEQFVAQAENGSGVVFEMLATICAGSETAITAAKKLGVAEQLLVSCKSKAGNYELTFDGKKRGQLAIEYIDAFHAQQPALEYRMLPAVWVAARLLAADARLKNFDPQRSPLRANWVSWRAARQAAKMKYLNEKM